MRGGDVERFRAVFEAYYPSILGYALRRAPTDAEDVVAETFTVAWKRLSDLPEGDSTLPWLYGVARRMLANHRRTLDRRSRLLARLRLQRPTPPNAESGAAVQEALASLSPADQEILRLHAWEDLGPAEIAQVLDISPNAAAIRLHRARRRLAERMRKESHPLRTQRRAEGMVVDRYGKEDPR